MKRMLSSITIAGSLMAGVSSAYADCPPWRPCGPGSSWGGNRLVPQFLKGADMRPACEQHDQCLANGCGRAYCDRQYLNSMLCQCQCADNPRACERKARFMYGAVRLFGGLYAR